MVYNLHRVEPAAIFAGEEKIDFESETADSSLIDNDSLDMDSFTTKKPSFLSRLFRSRISKKVQALAEKVDNASLQEFGDENTPMCIRQLIKDAHSGDEEAQFSLGYCYDVGQRIEINTNEAIFWYTLAANKGHLIAQNNLGVLYSTGHMGRVTKDPAEALHWYKLAAKQGNCNAQFHCGLAHMNGEGLEERDDAMAFYWFKKAAKQGHVLSMSNVGAMYMGGRGVDQNYKKACKWLMKAVDENDAVATHNLGVMYIHGYEVVADEFHGRDLIRQALSSNSIPAQLSKVAVQSGVTLYNS